MKTVILNDSIWIWMDHNKAIVIDVQQLEPIIHTIKSGIRKSSISEKSDYNRVGHFRTTNNEFAHHEREVNELHKYYKSVADNLEKYKTIYVFGPTTAHNEFCNYLLKQKAFSDKTIISENSDYLTRNQMVKHVKDSMRLH